MKKYPRPPQNGTAGGAPQRKSGGGTLLGLFIGLVTGVLIAFGVVWYLNKSPLPFQNKYEGAPRTDKEKPAAGANAATGPAAPIPLPGKPGDKPNDKGADKQRFEFYGILEGKQPPGAPPTSAAPAPVVVDAEKPLAEVYYLQVGAFQKPGDADNLKAKLALTGLDVHVQEVSIPDKGAMHRVRVGPFRGTEEMNRARAQLSQAGVQGTVVKQKE